MSRKDLNQDQRDQLAKLTDLPDDQIDTLDIPEAPAENWAYARRGEFYRPLKQPVTIRLDADVLDWFREHVKKGGGYQTEINRVLRHYVTEQERRRS
ncbi:BrnA antitoxin family protein [Mesorhizobium sp. B1-1-8]|uniref:BrnA antitoxin family protein n=1 Tax=Mesorhizobium sp. B1-1-8 TaxID=2589976 RepID=UPI00112BEA9A|nr:BrnA antitoxin family protein [Mesorhizobium sp. B1-1-8]UCI08398.1 BrnA antitoxin family protein [Mesorhizobium sp. B1-1-8]